MKVTYLSAVSLTALLLVSACAEPGSNQGINKQGAGTLLGAVGGAIVGSQIGGGTGRTVAIAAGTLLGAGLGNQIGASLDRADLAYYNQASQSALETGQPGQSLPWRNPQSGNSGTITPQAYRQTADGYCREYTQSITVGGRTQQGYGYACRQPDGSWQVVN